MHQAVFQQVNQVLSEAVRWRPLAAASGTSNTLYQGGVNGQLLILRVNADQELAFGVSRQREACVLDLLQGQRWAQQVVCNRPELGWCLMQHHGLALSDEAMNPAQQEDLLQLVQALHRVPLPEDQTLYECCLLDYPQLFLSYQQALNQLEKPLPWLELLNRLVTLFAQLPPVALCLTHHDLHPGNLCWQEQQLTLIDWEYAGIGNPWFDAGALARYCAVPETALAALSSFTHLSVPEFKQGLAKAEEALQLLEQLWFKVRGMPS